jgi:hypothetical protein
MRDGRPTFCLVVPVAARAAIVASLVAVAAGCDTGDGKTLRDTDKTMPPPTSTTIVDGTIIDGTVVDASSAVGNPLPGGSPAPTVEAEPAGLELVLPWENGAPIETTNTCDGADVAPAFSWSSPPPEAAELAIAMVDLSAGTGDGVVHWVMSGIDPAALSIVEGVVPSGAIPYENDLGATGWSGPCPPAGEPAHIYRFTLYALNQPVNAAEGTPTQDVLATIENTALERVERTGTYER